MKAFLNYTKSTMKEKKTLKLAGTNSEKDEETHKRAEAKQQESLDNLQQENEKLQKENKTLTRETKRQKSEITHLNEQITRLEDRVRRSRSESATPRSSQEVKIVIKEVEVIKEVQVERSSPRPAAIQNVYPTQNYWSGCTSILEDVLIMNQTRFNLPSKIEIAADLLRKYSAGSTNNPVGERTSSKMNLRDGHIKISLAHENWRKRLDTGLKDFFIGTFGTEGVIDVSRINDVVEMARTEHTSCLDQITEFFGELNQLEGSNNNADVLQIRHREKVVDELRLATKSIVDQYTLEIPNDIPAASSDTIPEEMVTLLEAWNEWFQKFANSSTRSILTDLNQTLGASLRVIKDVKTYLRREKSIFELSTISDSKIPVVQEDFKELPIPFFEFISKCYIWAVSVQAYFRNQIRSDGEGYRQQQARDEVRALVSTIQTQLKQHQEEEQEIEAMILAFQKIKISLKRLRSSIARDESKLLDYEIMMEEADLGDDMDMTPVEIEDQLQATKKNIEDTKERLNTIQEQRRVILRKLRNFALRGHLLVLTNTEIFDTQGFRNELLRGGMEDLYLVGENISDYEQVESFAKSVAKYQHKQDSSKECVMKRYEIMDEQQVKFFRNELKLLRKMQHPFVGSVNGVLFTKAEAYIQLPYYSGGSLRDRLHQIQQKRSQPDYAAKHEQRDFHELKRIFHEILQALAYLHSQSITHYDIKPENVVFDEFQHPILIDFGISEDPNSTLFTQNPDDVNSQIRGSVGYIAPEIKSGQPSILTSDCWSFGVMLFESFYSLPNYDLESLGISELPQHPDEDLRHLLKGFLSVDVSKRFTATQGLKSDFFSQKSYDKMFEKSTSVHSEKKLEAFRHFLDAIRNPDRLFIINIHRDRLVKDIFTEFRSKAKQADTMKFQTVVQYMGESGVDTGGLRRDLYSSFFHEICEPIYGMFKLSAEGKFYYPMSDATNLHEQFLLFGKILAKTLIDGDVIGDFFPISLFKFLADQADAIDLSDVYSYDKQLYGNLQSLLMQSIDAWELDWDIDENPKNYELITDSNKGEYILSKSRYVLIDQHKEAFNAIKQGFQSVPELLSHLALLSPVELRLLLSGETYIDGDMVLHQFQFEERWDKEDAQDARKNLCTWIRSDASADQLKLILMFTTASPTIPVGGFSPPIKVRYVDDSSRLPEGQTCVNMLMMPNYKDDYAILSKRFGIALAGLKDSGFQLN